MSHHMGYDKNQHKSGSNTRNGYSTKTVATVDGTLELRTPRDRDGSFVPLLVKKNQTRITGMDNQILSLYAKGMTTREIAATFKELYDADVSPVLDLYNGEIVAYQMEQRPHLSMVDDMLSKALTILREGEYPLLYSAQGRQYQMAQYQKRLKEAGLKQSMSRKGNCYDNAVIESFFGTLKSECLYIAEYRNIRELRIAIDEYIFYYNH